MSKQTLINEVDKLEKVDGDKENAKRQIIVFMAKMKLKTYDKLKIKSSKEKAKKHKLMLYNT